MPTTCRICGKPLDIPNYLPSLDCGGDCWACVQDAETSPPEPITLQADDLDHLADTLHEAVTCANDVDGVAWKQAASSLVRDLGAPSPASAGEGDLREAAKLALSVLDWQVTQTAHCGDPNYECPMQDIGNPDDEHLLAREALTTALARHQAPAVDEPAERDQKEALAEAFYIYERNKRSRFDTISWQDCLGSTRAKYRDIINALWPATLATRPTDPGGARGWRPIRSAPKDGTLILCLTDLSSGPEYNIGRFCDDEWHDGVGWYSDEGSDIGPSHWRPLPEPPAASTASSDAGGPPND